VLILRFGSSLVEFPLVKEEGDGRMRWRRGSWCPSSSCLAPCVERMQMEWNGVSSDRIRIPPLGSTLSLI
jgi:hypothetical protein